MNDTYFIWAGANDFVDPLADPANADIPTIISDGVTNLITSVSTLNALGAENIVLANLVNLGLLPAADGIETQATAISTTFNDALETALDSLDFEVTLLDFFGIGNTVAANPGDFDFSNIDDALLFEATTPDNPEEFFFWDTIHPTTQGHNIFAQAISQTLTGEAIEPFLFSADLTGNQEVDPGDGDATGTAELRLNELGTGLRYDLTISGLDFGSLAGVAPQTTETDDDVVGLHIHQGNRGENGDVVFGIVNPTQDDDDFTVVINDDGSATISGVWDESDPANQSLSNFVTDLRSTADGEDTDLYFNIHTAGFPSGAIRGQIAGGETIVVNPPVDDGVTVNDDNSFTLSGTGAVNLEFNLVGVNATFVNEVGIYRREDGQTTQDILENGQVIFSALGNLGDFSLPSRILSNFSAGDEIGFYLVANTTKDAVLAGEFGTEQVILGNTTTIQTISQNGGEFTLNFEDAAGTDFDDVQITMAVTENEPAIGSSLQGEVELIDLRDFESQSINGEVRVTRNASFDNVGGLYLAVDENGTVVDSVTGNLVQPGDSNYAEVALSQSVVDFTAESFASTVLQGGFVYVPYILSDGDTTQFYSTFATANPDGLEHIVSLGDNSFGFEDLLGGGDRSSGVKFCQYTGFPQEHLFVDPCAELHQQLELYPGITWQLPGLSSGQNAWLNLMLMCAGIGSPGTLREVFRGYLGDKKAPQLIEDEEVIHGKPLPPLKGKFFGMAGGKGFQRPFELATLRLRNMTEVLSNWSTYVPNSAYLTQRGGTFLFDSQGSLLYEHRDGGILGFAENMSCPLAFLP